MLIHLSFRFNQIAYKLFETEEQVMFIPPLAVASFWASAPLNTLRHTFEVMPEYLI